MYKSNINIADFDPVLYQALQQERQRQEDHIELIASENFASPRVLEAYASLLTNKYAEGYPAKRYYGGCQFVDIVEQLAIDRAKQLFAADYVNVQPHSGSQANAAVYQALLTPGDTLLGMSLAAGGHLTHGSHVNFSGKLYRGISYGVDANSGLIDYDEVKKLAQQHQPKMIIAGASAYPRIIDWQPFRDIADEINAYFVVDMAHIAGLVAVGIHPSPLPLADVVTSTTHKTLRGPRGGIILARGNDKIIKKLQSAIFPGMQGGPLMHVIAAKAVAFKEALSFEFKAYQQQVVANAKAMAKTLVARGYDIATCGSDNHLCLIDLRRQGITGQAAETALDLANITVNKNAVPNDPQKPFITSGLRIGTPAITTRGFKEKQTITTAHWIADILAQSDNSTVIADIKQKVIALCRQFPVYEYQKSAILTSNQ